MPKHIVSAAAIGSSKRHPVTNANRRAIMQAAHRTQSALGIGLGEALKHAWKHCWRRLEYRWPVDTKLTMPHEAINVERTRSGKR